MSKWSETPWGQKFAAMSRRTTFLFGGAVGGLAVLLAFVLLPKKAALALAAALVLAFGAGGAASWVDDVHDVAKSSDSVGDQVVKAGPGNRAIPLKDKGTFLLSPADEKYAMLEEFDAKHHRGTVVASHYRPCQAGRTLDLTYMTNEERALWEEAAADSVCGVLWESTQANFLTDEGESDYLACFQQGVSAAAGVAGCYTAGFTLGYLSAAASPTEASTWASLSSTELVTGNAPGYASWTAARANTGFYGTTSGTAPTTIANGVGGCTESGSTCAQVRTASNTTTASGNWATNAACTGSGAPFTCCTGSGTGTCNTAGVARYMYVRATTANRLFAVAQLAADRNLVSGDQLNGAYFPAQQ